MDSLCLIDAKQVDKASHVPEYGLYSLCFLIENFPPFRLLTDKGEENVEAEARAVPEGSADVESEAFIDSLLQRKSHEYGPRSLQSIRVRFFCW